MQYQFWVYNPAATPAWSQLQAYSASATCLWTPAAAGNYLLSVTAQDGITGTEVNTTLLVYHHQRPADRRVARRPLPTSPQPVNTPITLTATATGGTNVQYQFWLYNPAATPAWSQLQAYSTLTTCTWTPAAAGNYLLSVTAQDGATGTEVNTTLWYTITAGTPLTAVSVTPSPASPQPANTPITLTATATGGTNVQYQFWMYNPAATPAWSQLQAYSAADHLHLDAGGSRATTCSPSPRRTASPATEVNTTLWYTISRHPADRRSPSPPRPPRRSRPTRRSPSPRRRRAARTCNISSGCIIRRPPRRGANCRPIPPLTTCTWTPAAAGNYLLSVTAQDGVTGTEVNTTCWYTITAGIPLTAVSVTASPGLAATGQHADHPHRDGDGRHERAISVLGV